MRFLLFLEQADPRENQLYLLGDIFDLWVGGGDFFVKKYQPIVDSLARLKERGMQILFIEGNHDLHIDAFFTKVLKIPVYVEKQYVQINHQIVRIEHGDLINLDDKAYLRYRGVVRHPLVRPLSQIIPGSWWNKLGQKASEKSRKHSSKFHEQNEEKLIQMIRHHAHRALREEERFDVLVSGHMHVFDTYRFEEGGKQATSYNLGSWLGKQVQVLCLDEQGAQWVELE